MAATSNFTHEVKSGKLIITVDISANACKKAALSKSGKNKNIATTGGFVPISGSPAGWAMSFGLNVIGKSDSD